MACPRHQVEFVLIQFLVRPQLHRHQLLQQQLNPLPQQPLLLPQHQLLRPQLLRPQLLQQELKVRPQQLPLQVIHSQVWLIGLKFLEQEFQVRPETLKQLFMHQVPTYLILVQLVLAEVLELI